MLLLQEKDKYFSRGTLRAVACIAFGKTCVTVVALSSDHSLPLSLNQIYTFSFLLDLFQGKEVITKKQLKQPDCFKSLQQLGV